MTDEKDSTPQASLRTASRTLSLTGRTELLLKGKRGNLTPQNAWEEGTNIRTALRLNPQMVRAWFLAELGRLIKFVDATKTIQDNDAQIAQLQRSLCIKAIKVLAKSRRTRYWKLLLHVPVELKLN